MKFFKSKFMRIMRLTIVIITIALMQVSAAGLAQKVSLSFKNVPLEQVLVAVKQQTAYNFVYTEDVIAKAKRVTIHLKDADLKDALLACFQNQPLNFTIEQNTIVVKEKEPSFLDNLLDRFAAVDVRGRVLDEAGNPLVGATIQVKGKAQAYKTKENGEFEIKGVDEDAVLLVSYVGFKTLEISLKDAVMPLEIKLNVATGELEEVKVVYNTGYQELNKERSTGSFVQIDNELFNRAVGTNVLDRIYNVTSGLIFNPSAGVNTSNNNKNNIVVRGISTIQSSSDALVVVDNFPYDGDLKHLNPNDVESITVLKDAAAASIWGVRAGNGVIVITTKKGKYNESTNIDFNSNVTIKEKPDLFYIPYMSSEDILEVEKLKFSRGIYNEYDDLYPSIGIFPVLPQSIELLLAARKKNSTVTGYNALTDPSIITTLNKLSNHDVRSDIKKYLLQMGIDQQYSLNLTGGGNNFNYYSSVGYDRNRGNDLNKDYRRISLNFINTWRPIKKIEISTGIVHTRGVEDDSGLNYNNFLPKSEISPYTRLIDDEGNSLAIPYGYRTAYVDTASFPALLDWHYKPLEDFKYINNVTKTYDTRLSGSLKYTIQSWLKAEFQYQSQLSLINTRNYKEQQSFDVRNQINTYMSKDATGKLVYPFPLGDQIDLNNSTFKAWNLRGRLSFSQQFGKHQIDAFTGLEIRETTSEGNPNKIYGFDPETYVSKPVDVVSSFPVRPSGSFAIPSSGNPYGNITRNGSFYGNGAYNYNGKYLFTLSGRIDQSNFFGLKANLRRIPLWHAGVGWNLHREEFYHIYWLSLLKLKASYGYTGNTTGATSYATMRYTTASENVPPRNISYGEILSPSNPQLRWERQKIINLGFEFTLRNNRINGSIEVYQKNGLDLIGSVLTDPTSGVTSFTGNQASIKGKGFDITLNTRNVIKGSFEWNTTLLLNYNQDKLSSYFGSKLTPSTIASSNLPLIIGFPLYSIFSLRSAGLDPKTGDPRIYLSDTVSTFTNVNNIKEEDLVYKGGRNPKISGSIINYFKWRNISVSANITYRMGHSFRRNSIGYVNLLGAGWSGHADYKLRWMKPGDELLTAIPSMPLIANSSRDAAYINSDVLIEKADYIRLQDIRFDYRLDRMIFKRLPLKSLSIYIYAANLGILWRANNRNLDPDAYVFGRSPVSKTISLGLNANF